MADLLTTKELQTLLQVDRSTIYRMAEARRLPAIKVGKQWRFPADQIEAGLQGMVIMGGVAPDDWPPPPEQVAETATVFGLPPDALTPQLNEVYYLEQAQQNLVLSLVQRMADILAHLAAEQSALADKLEAISELTTL